MNALSFFDFDGQKKTFVLEIQCDIIRKDVWEEKVPFKRRF